MKLSLLAGMNYYWIIVIGPPLVVSFFLHDQTIYLYMFLRQVKV